MMWNQRRTQKRWALEERYTQAETRFHKFARARLAQKTEHVRGDNSSPWNSVPKVDVCVAPFEGATAKPKGSVALGKESKARRAKQGHWGARHVPVGTRKLSETRQSSEQISEPCSNGVIQASQQIELQRLQDRINSIN